MDKIRLFFILPAVIHCLLSIFYTSHFNFAIGNESKIIYFFSKIISFFVIFMLWQSIACFINAIIQKNKKIIDFGKYTIFYLIINLLMFAFLYPAPSSHVDITGQFLKVSHYNFDWWMYFVHNCFCIVFYHILPEFQGYIISSMILYSFIFGYCIYCAKYYLSNKYYWLLIIPFLFPLILVYNQIPRRNVISAWIFIFLFMFFIINARKEYKGFILTSVIGFISAILVHFRYEFCILTILLPAIVYFLKIFDKKSFFIYLTVFVFMFLSIFLIQKNKIYNLQYERENLPFVLMTLEKRAGYNLTSKDIEILKKVSINENEVFIINEFANENDLKNAMFHLKKLMLINLLPLIQANYNYYIWAFNESDYLMLKPSLMKEYYPRPADNYFEKSFYSHYDKEKLLSKIIYLTDDYKISGFVKFFYSMKLNFIILFVLFIFGFLTKKIIYSIFSLIWAFIILIILSILYTKSFIYVYPFILNTWIMLFTFITDVCEEKNKTIKY